MRVKKTGLIAVTVVATLLAGCSEGDLRQLGKDTEKALRDAGGSVRGFPSARACIEGRGGGRGRLASPWVWLS